MNNETERYSPQLKDLLNSQMSQSKFDEKISEILTFGESGVFENERFPGKIYSKAIIISAIYAPSPAKIEKEDYIDVLKEISGLDSVNEQQVDSVLNFCIRVGLLEKTEDDYLIIPDKDLQKTISEIGENYY